MINSLSNDLNAAPIYNYTPTLYQMDRLHFVWTNSKSSPFGLQILEMQLQRLKHFHVSVTLSRESLAEKERLYRELHSAVLNQIKSEDN